MKLQNRTILAGTMALLITTTLSFSASSSPLNAQLQAQPTSKSQESCYWMENYSKKFEWVLAETVYKRVLTKEECFELDSCDGGKGFSNGGCYKWASSATADREHWNK